MKYILLRLKMQKGKLMCINGILYHMELKYGHEPRSYRRPHAIEMCDGNKIFEEILQK
jgi:hypothetical protein